MNYYIDAFKKYADFNGRATRKEYWMFVLFNIIISIAISFIGGIIFSKTISSILSTVYVLAVVIPSLAVMVRRLHDTNHSGWWFFINLIPIVGFIIIFIFTVSDSQPVSNQYGTNPKEVVV